MKLVVKDSNRITDSCFHIYEKTAPCFDGSWHFHKEYELLLITKSSGIRFVGDNVSNFLPGDLVLVGPHLPHLWRNNPSYYNQSSKKSVRTIVIKFHPDFLGRDLFKINDFVRINSMLEKAKYGIYFGLRTSNILKVNIIELLNLSGAEKVIKLLSVLDLLSKCEDYSLLSVSDMRQKIDDKKKRWDNVIKFMSDNYSKDISLANVSDIACMTTNSFCRFFKNMTNKSFTVFLNEIRINNAARLLIQQENTISNVSYDVGYKSITNFNRQFKKIIGITPSEYKRKLQP
ncbi:MAG: AraC family transcriptional regulator [Bacteroidales bacterium]